MPHVRIYSNCGRRPAAALWVYSADADRWRLVIAEADFNRIGPRQAYRRMQKLLSKKKIGLPLAQIVITDPRSPMVAPLKSVVRTGRGIAAIRLKNSVINGIFFDDAYVYRVA